MKAIVNKYAGICEVCEKSVGEKQGFIVLGDDGKWVRSTTHKGAGCWCKDHVPVHKGKTSEERRLLIKDGIGCCVTPYEHQNLDLFRAMPGAHFCGKKDCKNVLGKPYWQVSLKTGDRSRLLELADRLDLDVDDKLREVEISEQAKQAKGLYPFQVVGVDWLVKGKLRLLADEMGLGKTVQALVALPPKAAALVVCPASLKYNWEAECIKWRSDLTPVIINGKGAFRFPKAGEVVIVNFDILPTWLEPTLRDPKAKPAKLWDVVVTLPQITQAACGRMVFICDEAHKLKNASTLRTKRCKGLAMVCGQVWALTGTPLENRPMDLWGTLDCLGMSYTVFGGWKRFLKVMNGSSNGWGGWDFGTPDPIVPELLRRVMLRRLRNSVLPDLPQKQYHTIKVELPAELKSQMDSLWDEWGDLIDEKELPPFEEFSAIRAALAKSRIPALLDLIDDHEEQEVPLVVFSAHRAPVLACGEREGWECITGSTPSKKRQEIVQRFQAGKLKGLALTIKAGGTGLTLTHAWKVICVDLEWVPSWNHQAEDRVCRIGQLAEHVEIIRMVSDHVLDIHVQELIDWKIGVIIAAVEKLIQTQPQNSNHETNEEFAQRMAEAAFIADGLACTEDENELSNTWSWPEIKIDSLIPF